MAERDIQTKLDIQKLFILIENLSNEVKEMNANSKEVNSHIMKKLEDHLSLPDRVKKIEENLRWFVLTVLAGFVAMLFGLFNK